MKNILIRFGFYEIQFDFIYNIKKFQIRLGLVILLKIEQSELTK